MAGVWHVREELSFINMFGVFCLLTLLNLDLIKASNVTCHSQCVCLPNSSFVNCSSQALKSVPDSLPRNTSLLLLKNNELATLSPEIITSLPLLRRIDITDNPINCDCSLNWIFNDSVNLQIIGKCDRPSSLKGKNITDITNEEMCYLKLTSSPSPVVRLEEETLTLDCESSPAASLQWSRKTSADPQLQDVQGLGNRFRVLSNGTLIITELEESDEGEYICFARHKYGTRANTSIILTVRKRPSFVVKPSNISLIEGHNGTLDCAGTGDGNVSLQWEYSARRTEKLDKNHFRVLSNGTLVITNVHVDHSGSYVCVIRSGDLTKEAYANLHVQRTCKIDMQSSSNTLTMKPTKSYYIADDVLNLSCRSGYFLNGSTWLSCLVDGSWNTTFPTCQKISAPTTPAVTRPTQSVQTNSTTERPTTRTQRPEAPEERSNLKDLIKMSNETRPSIESLRNLLEMLETNVRNWSYGGENKTKSFLHVASNLLRNENRASWTKSNQNFSGVERLLRTVNKAMNLQAKEMLKKYVNDSELLVEFDNLLAEILVGTGSKMVKQKLQFPRSRSPQDDYIEFSSSIFQNAGKKKVAVIVISFSDLEELLPQRSLVDNFGSFQVNSRVLSGNIISLDGDISGPVLVTFKNKNVPGTADEFKCVFWKYHNSMNASNGGWSDEGCTVSSKGEKSTICKCNHLTDFAVLASKGEVKPPKPLVIAYIGSLILFVAVLIAFIRNIVAWRKTRRERLLVLINECLAIMFAVLVFLLGGFLDYHETMCTTFGVLMHWFLLSVFTWMLVEVVQLYYCVRFGSSRNSTRLKYFLFLGWVTPMIFVGAVLAITKLKIYGSNHWCWYNDSMVLHLAYVCPIALCIVIGFIVILKVACLKADLTDDSDKKDVSVMLVSSGFLLPLVAATFATCTLSANQPGKEVFQYFFAVLSIILGIYILVYHILLDREITKMSVRANNRSRPKRDYYSTKETVMYSEGTSEGKSFSLIFPSRKSPSHGKKSSKGDKRSNKRSDSSSPFDYDSALPMYPAINDSSLRSFRSQVSTQQHTLDNPPNTLSAITISRPNSQSIELTSLLDLDRRPDGAEQTDCGEHSDFYGPTDSNPLDTTRQRTSGSSDSPYATTFGKDSGKPVPDKRNDHPEQKNRVSTTSSAGRSSVSGSSLGPVEENEDSPNDTSEKRPLYSENDDRGPEVKSDPPAKIPKRRKKGSRRRLDDDFQDEETKETTNKANQESSTLSDAGGSIKL